LTVAIVGAGPAGAALALLLARRGVAVVLAERHTDFAREFRGEGLMPGGVDALQQMGLGAALDSLPQSRVDRIEIYQERRQVLAVDIPEVTGVAAGPRFVSQPALLELLVAEASRHPSFRFERGLTVRELLRQDGRVAGARGDTPAGAREIAADFVIGTDGRASLVRRRAGLDHERAPQSFDIVWFKLPLPDFLSSRHVARAYLGEGHFCLLFPAPDGLLQIGWVIEKGSFGELRGRGIDEWLSQLAHHVTPDLASHIERHRAGLEHPFLLDVVCDHLEEWTAPGVLLLGDAAHPMSPVGAQGINIALRDALVAANHLGPCLLAGEGPAGLDAAARRVTQERLPEVRTIQRLQQLPPRVLFQRTRASRLLVGSVLPLLARSGLAGVLFRSTFRRFALGTVDVKLAF
jgi:2-polyprenyl-6-methoxyphenol hydroxylase-like FAD-dependent oxidoreductase